MIVRAGFAVPVTTTALMCCWDTTGKTLSPLAMGQNIVLQVLLPTLQAPL